MPLKNGEEEIFTLATSKQAIKNSPLQDLENVLRLVMLKIGLRAENLPSKEEKAVLIDHILSNYGNHTIEEIRVAFEMALAYKLDLTEKEIICYENFSCMYFSKIMNAYRVWAIDVYRHISNKQQPLIEEKKELTEQEWDEWLQDIRKYDFKLIPCSAYDYLTKKGLINLSVKVKHEYMNKAIAQLFGTLEPGTKEMIDFCEMKVRGIYSAEITASLITISKRFAIYDYLNHTDE